MESKTLLDAPEANGHDCRGVVKHQCFGVFPCGTNLQRKRLINLANAVGCVEPEGMFKLLSVVEREFIALVPINQIIP